MEHAQQQQNTKTKPYNGQVNMTSNGIEHCLGLLVSLFVPCNVCLVDWHIADLFNFRNHSFFAIGLLVKIPLQSRKLELPAIFKKILHDMIYMTNL
jgi:hypothetical protein